MPRFPGFFTQGHNIITVAASNTPQRFREGADYITDGVADQVEIQAAIVQAGTEGSSGNPGSFVMLLPGNYTLSASINMSVARVSLVGWGSGLANEVSISGASFAGSTTPVILITTNGVLVKGLDISGTGYGIEINSPNGTDHFIENYIHNCGNYGLYIHGGANNIIVDTCRIENNVGANIHCLTPNSGEQNGNASRITNSHLGGSSARSVVWNASGLYFAGNNVEGSGNIGLAIGENTTNGPFGITIVGNYFEGWTNAAIRLGDSGASVSANNAAEINTSGFFISGNYIQNGGASAGIQQSQVLAGFIVSNSITSDSTGPSIRTITSSQNVIIGPIQDEGSTRSTLSQAMILGDYQTDTAAARRIRLNGDSQQAGLAWTAGSYQSNNFAGLGAQNGYWHLPVKPGDYIEFFSINAGADAGDTTVVALERLSGNIGGVYGTTWNTVTLDAGSDTNPSAALDASLGVVWNCLHRIESGYVYRLRTTFTPGAGGTRTVRPPTLHYVTE